MEACAHTCAVANRAYQVEAVVNRAYQVEEVENRAYRMELEARSHLRGWKPRLLGGDGCKPRLPDGTCRVDFMEAPLNASKF